MVQSRTSIARTDERIADLPKVETDFRGENVVVRLRCAHGSKFACIVRALPTTRIIGPDAAKSGLVNEIWNVVEAAIITLRHGHHICAMARRSSLYNDIPGFEVFSSNLPSGQSVG